MSAGNTAGAGPFWKTRRAVETGASTVTDVTLRGDVRVLRNQSVVAPGRPAEARAPAAKGKAPPLPFEAGGVAAPKPKLDAQLAGAYAEFTKVLAAAQGGQWAALDGSTPKWNERQLLDVQGRFGPLSMDPAKGKMSPGSVEEAAIGLAAERAGVVPGPITRESTGQAEFVDGNGKFWDVKSPVSPWPGAKWTFDAMHQVEKVKHDISQDNTVLLNLSRVTKEDTATLLTVLRAQLTEAELHRVMVLTTDEVLRRE